MVRREYAKNEIYNQQEKRWEYHRPDASTVSPILDAIVDSDPGLLLNSVIEVSLLCPICERADCEFYHTRSRSSSY